MKLATAERVKAARECIEADKCQGRAFDNLFEMGDGVDVVALLCQQARYAPNIKLRAGVRRNWRLMPEALLDTVHEMRKSY